MSSVENILNAIYPFAPHATIAEDRDGYLIVKLNLFIDPTTGRAEALTFDPGEFDE
jgi:hypothetical protein